MRLLLVTDLLILPLLSVCSGSASLSCCPSNASITSSSGCVRPHMDTRTAIYMLVTVPFPDDREIAGWDYGMEMLPGGRIARDFINCNHSDLLPGYRLELIETNHEACDISPQTEAYINLIRYGLDQECGPVMAVAGLPCSSTTVGISLVAGRNDLIQLASAVSPVFEQDSHFSRYPRLWRYLSSARVYVDVVIELMSRLGWSSIGLIHDLESEYYFNIAQTFIEAVKTNNFTLRSSFGLESTNPKLLSDAIQSIKDTGIKIIFCSTTFTQSTALICRAANEGLVSPNYLWIFPDIGIKDFEEQIMGIDCTSETLYKGINRSLLLQYDIVNGAQIPGMLNYLDLYKQHLEEVQRDYNYSGREFISTGFSYSQLLFDQIWSFANALNQSLPHLHSMHISLKHNTVGNTPFADLLEDALSQLNILGITGRIHFNQLQLRVYPTSVRVVYPIITNSSIISGTIVGRYQNKRLSFILNRGDVPRDFNDPILDTVPITVIASMYLVILIVTVLTSIVLGLFYHNRKKPKVKASNPFLTVFMFIGCYLLCLAALLRITYGGFGGLAGGTIRVIFLIFSCLLEFFLEQNGLSVILVTLFIKLLHVHHIFNTNKLRKLSSAWKNRSLAAIVLILCFIPNLMFFVLFGIFSIPTFTTVLFRMRQQDENSLRIYYTCYNQERGVLFLLIYSPLAIYLIFIIYLSFTMRKIKDTNFKDTKKVNIFVTIISLLSLTYIFSSWLLLEIFPRYDQYVAVVQSLFPLTVVVACQVILLIPKITPSCCEKAVNSHQSRSYMLPWQFNTKLVGSFMPWSGEYQSQPA